MSATPAPSPLNAAIVVAGGSGTRMGSDKLFADLCGVPVLAHSLLAFQQCAAIDWIVVVARADRMEAVRALCLEFSKAVAPVEGGALRQNSVLNGLRTLPPSVRWVAVHDGARPLVTPAIIGHLLEVAEKEGAACSAVPVADTLKKADADNQISGSVDRSGLWAVQTPQVFRAGVLTEAYCSIPDGTTITDETSAVERMGGRVTLVQDPGMNLKVTYPRDLELVRLILESRQRGGGL